MRTPLDLVIVRHGESVENEAKDQKKAGNLTLWEELRNVDPADYALTPRGQDQARATGAWIREHIGGHFDRYYTSAFRRAQWTAGLLELPDAVWQRDESLTEKLDYEMRLERDGNGKAKLSKRRKLYGTLPESDMLLALRLRQRLIEFKEEAPDGRVIAVCHGSVMWMLRYILEGFDERRHFELLGTSDPAEMMRNCQILHYTRRNPHKKTTHESCRWFRSICGWDPTLSVNDWRAIKPSRFTNEELVDEATNWEHNV